MAQDYSSCIVQYFLQVGCHIIVEPNCSVLQWAFRDKVKADTSVAVAVHVGNLQIDAKRHSSKYHDRAILETCAFVVR